MGCLKRLGAFSQDVYSGGMEQTHDEVTAYHEAGHAVIALALGRTIHKVSVLPNRERLGECRFGKGNARATDDWLEPAQIAGIAGGRVVRAPMRMLVVLSEVAYRARLLPFGADRAVLLGGPLALDPTRAREAWGWRASQASGAVLGGFLAAQSSRR